MPRGRIHGGSLSLIPYSAPITTPTPTDERYPRHCPPHDLLDLHNALTNDTANWLWFRVFSNLALRTISSSSYNPTQLTADLARLDSFQFPDNPAVGGDEQTKSSGWCNDGPKDVWQRDYYSSSFAITFAMLVYAMVSFSPGYLVHRVQ